MAGIVRNNNLCAKLVLLGNSGTGKTSLVFRFVRDQFIESQMATVGVAFSTQEVVVSEDTTVKFEIWDTAGQERYGSLAPLYCRGAAAAIIVYDITDTESFLRAKIWVQQLIGEVEGSTDIVMALVGNKVDLEGNRMVNAEEAHSYAKENGIFFFETSAKNGTNVNKILYELAQKLPRTDLQKLPRTDLQKLSRTDGTVILQPVDPAILSRAARWWTCYLL